MPLLEVKNLQVTVEDKEILKGLSLSVNAGEVHAIMGPNGSGKSTLARALAGHPAYEVTGGSATYDGKDLLEMAPEDRARDGVFMAFQYPVEIPGIQNGYFLKAALNALRKHRGEPELDAVEFMQFVRAKAKSLGMDQPMLSRSVNEGFSGGEKKRNEIFQMAVLEPRLAILDETDSGLDIDALQIVAEGVNALRSPRPRDHRRHPLPAPARLHRARLRARALRRPHRAIRRQGARARARSQGLRLGRCRPGGSEGLAMTAVAERHEALAAEFEAFRRDPAFGAGASAANSANRAFARFLDRGFPTTRDEEWKFTSVAPIAALTFARAAAASPARAAIEPFLFAGLGVNIVLVNGRLARGLSSVDALPRGRQRPVVARRARPTASRDRRHRVRRSQHRLSRGGRDHRRRRQGHRRRADSCAQPVDRRRAADRWSCRVCVIVAGEASEVSIVESYAGAGDGQTLTCPVTTDRSRARARWSNHVKIQRETSAGFHLASTSRPSAARQHVHFVRADATAAASRATTSPPTLAGEGAECTLDGLYVVDGDTVVDTHTTIDHAMPHCPSHELYKGILSGRSRAVFNGKIIVRQDAQKTNAKQTNKALLLTDEAQVNTQAAARDFRRRREVHARRRDRAARRGRAVLLAARGIGAHEARNLLIHAFAGEVLDDIARSRSCTTRRCG